MRVLTPLHERAMKCETKLESRSRDVTPEMFIRRLPPLVLQSVVSGPVVFSSAVYERRLVSTEKPLNQFVTADFKMRSHVIKNSGQCSHFQRIVIGNRDMMLAALSGRQPQMATRLPCDFVAQAPQPFGKIRSRNISR